MKMSSSLSENYNRVEINASVLDELSLWTRGKFKWQLKEADKKLWARRIWASEKEIFGAPVGTIFVSWFAEGLGCSENYNSVLEAGLYLYLYVVMQDDIIDNAVEENLTNRELAKTYRKLAFDGLAACHDEADRVHLLKYLNAADQRMLNSDQRLVARYNSQVGIFVPDLAATVGKCCLLKATGLVLAVINRQEKNWPQLSKAYDLMAIGNAFCDDLKDWRDDLAVDHNTLVISLAKNQLLKKDIFQPTEAEIAGEIFDFKIAGKLASEARGYIQKSNKIFAMHGCETWLRFGNMLIAGIEKLMEIESDENTTSRTVSSEFVMQKNFPGT